MHRHFCFLRVVLNVKDRRFYALFAGMGVTVSHVTLVVATIRRIYHRVTNYCLLADWGLP